MSRFDFPAAGAATLRIALGVLYLMHGLYLKVFVFTVPGTVQFFQSIGLPGPLAHATIAVETLGGLALILGLRTRWVALALLPIALGATWTHFGNGWLFTNAGGGFEFPLFLSIATAAQAMLGSGLWSLDHAMGGRRVAALAH